ncbi:SMP-30/gluconolactonase/LRE family protein [Thalassotalea litorea]|nr:SMP-30/gluconolactonase/LRE family protein [Thalassotalea litorea]
MSHKCLDFVTWKALVFASLWVTSMMSFCAQVNAVERTGIYSIYDQAALQLLDISQNYAVVADGFEWAEGPLWFADEEFLLFSDIPANKIYRYDEKRGLTEFLTDSGFSNGLCRNGKGQLLMMQSRTRQVALLNQSPQAHSIDTKPDLNVLMRDYQGKRLNSPNDCAVHANGTLFFTDPPYGLAGQLNDPLKELSFQGIFRVTDNVTGDQNEITLVDDSLTFPNGIALSPDHKWLYVAVSDQHQPAWYRYRLSEQGDILAKELFYTPEQSTNEVGAPDGLKVHSNGWVFATGPGGIWIFNQNQQLLARIHLPGFTANLAFADNETLLYLTSDNELRKLRLQTNTTQSLIFSP